MTTSGLRAASRHAVAPTLVLTSSFVHFVRSHDHSLVAPEILLGLLGVTGVGAAVGLLVSLRPSLGPILLAPLLVWFVDVHLRVRVESPLVVAAYATTVVAALVAGFALRAHLERIVSVAFGTVLVSTLLLGVRAPASGAAASSSEPPSRSDLPVVVHLILDEHIGLDGIPDDGPGRAVRDRLAAFYLARGFYVFPRALSQHAESRIAISHALNFAGRFDETLAVRASGRFPWRMTRNEYLARMEGRGYRPRVYQPDFMDLCSEGAVAAGRCYTYEASTLRSIARTPLSIPAKLRITAGMYLIGSRLYKRSRDHYRSLHSGGLALGVALPGWDWERVRPHTIAAMSALDLLASELRDARPGDLFLGHLLIPHYPYVYDSACRLRPDPGDWLERGRPERPTGAPNDAASRAARYALYLEQVECVTEKLDMVLAALRQGDRLERAIVLVHGDHGSRITITDPILSTRGRVTASDFTDTFSTLFAVRAPGIEAGSDDGPWSLAELIRHFVTVDFRSVPARRPDRPMPDVYIWKDGTDTYVPERAEMFGPRPGRGRQGPPPASRHREAG